MDNQISIFSTGTGNNTRSREKIEETLNQTNYKSRMQISEIEQKLLDELATDEYGYDLRNWKAEGITEDEIRKRYETCDKENDYPNISASRYFSFVLPKLKNEFNTPIEKIIEVIMQSREKNWRKLKENWLSDVKSALLIYLTNKTEKNLEWAKRCYEEYIRYCRLLNETPVSKKSIWDSVKKKFEKKQNGLL